jgi:hypothetical protein
MNTLWIASPVAAKKATGMVEKANNLIQRVLKKERLGTKWPLRVQSAAFELNRREVIYLNYSPFKIAFGYQPLSRTDHKFGQLHHVQSRAFLSQLPL